MADDQAQPMQAAEDLFNVSDDEMLKIIAPEVVAQEEPKAPKAEAKEAEDQVEIPIGDTEEEVEEEAEDVEGEEEGEGEEEDGDEEEGEEEPQPGKPPLTKFKIFDGDGDEVDSPKGLTFSYKANGREYDNVPLDKLVSLAQMGHYNHEREQEVKQRETKAEQSIQREKQLEQSLAQVNELVTRIFEDVEAYDRAREAYLAENTPEARARRSEHELSELRRQQQEDREMQYVASYVDRELAPALTSLIEGHPNVSEYEVQGKFSELTAPMLVRGRLPVNRLQDVRSLIERDLTNWVKAIAESRVDGKVVAKKKQLDEAEKKAIAKRTVARKVKPGGKSPGTREPPKKIESADDFLDSVLGS